MSKSHNRIWLCSCTDAGFINKPTAVLSVLYVHRIKHSILTCTPLGYVQVCTYVCMWSMYVCVVYYTYVRSCTVCLYYHRSVYVFHVRLVTESRWLMKNTNVCWFQIFTSNKINYTPKLIGYTPSTVQYIKCH